MGNIKPNELQKVLNDYLMNYREDIQDDVVEVTDRVTKEAVKELKQDSEAKFGKSKRAKPYCRGWATKIQKRGPLKYHKVIWNRTNYQLTHLLEFGHDVWNGGNVKATPHIKPIEEKYSKEFVDLVMERIRRNK